MTVLSKKLACNFVVALALSGCGLGKDEGSTTRVSEMNESELVRREAFRATVYPIVRKDCALCHSASQTPIFASPDLAVAYFPAVETVNWEKLASSKIIAKSTDGHCQLPLCQTDGSQMLDAVKAWNEQWKLGTTAPVSVKWNANVDAGSEEGLYGLTPGYQATLTLSRAVDYEVKIAYEVSGTADADDHGLTETGEIVFPPLTKEAKLLIPIKDDALFEKNETVAIKLVVPDGIEIAGTPSFTLTIQNDSDPSPDIQWKLAEGSVTEGADFVLEAELSAPSSLDASALIEVVVPAGVNANEIRLSQTTIVIPAGMTTASVRVSRMENALDEPAVPILVKLVDPMDSVLGSNSINTLTVVDNDLPPTVQWELAASTVSESVGVANFVAALSAPSAFAVTAPFVVSSAADAAARGFMDGAVTIAPGQLSGSVAISVTNDTIFQGTQTIVLTAANPVNATLGTRVAHTITLTDDEVAPVAEWVAATSSVNESVGTASVTARLNRASTVDVTISYTVAGSATAADRTLANGTFKILAGNTTGDLSFAVAADLLDEPDETVVVTLTTAVGGSVGTAKVHTLTLVDDDPLPTVNFTAASQTVGENVGNVTVRVALSAASGRTVTVPYVVSGTAANPSDHNLASGNITIAAGSLTADFSFQVVSNTVAESNETVILTLGSTSTATLGTTKVHTVTITENSQTPIVSWAIASNAVAEAVGTVTLVANLTSQSANTITVPITLSGTGSLSDFSLSSQSVTIPPNTGSSSVTVTVTQDLIDENNETIVLTMGTPTNAALGSISVHTLTVTDDDNAPTVAWNAATQSVAESVGTATITAVLSAASGKAITVPFTVTGTAANPADHRLAAGTLSFAIGATSASASFQVIDDTVFEGNETVIATLGTPTNATLGTVVARTVTITDNEALPVVQWSAASQSRAENIGTVEVTGVLNHASINALSVAYTITGTAIAADHNLVAGTLQIPAGSLSSKVTFTVTNDVLSENAETVILTMGTVTGGSSGTTKVHTVTITDNDPLPVVSFSAAAQTVAESVGNITASVRLSVAAGRDVVVPYTVRGTASAPGDHGYVAGSVTILKGALSASLASAVVEDTLYEGTEDIVLTLGAPTGATATLGSPSVHTKTISDNDTPPVLLVGGNLEIQSFYQYEQKLLKLFSTVSIVMIGTLYQSALQAVSDDGDPGDFSDPMAAAYVVVAHAHCRQFVAIESALADGQRQMHAGANLTTYSSNTEAIKRTVIRRYAQALWTRDPLSTEEGTLLTLMDTAASTVTTSGGTPALKAYVAACTAVASSPEGIRN